MSCIISRLFQRKHVLDKWSPLIHRGAARDGAVEDVPARPEVLSSHLPEFQSHLHVVDAREEAVADQPQHDPSAFFPVRCDAQLHSVDEDDRVDGDPERPTLREELLLLLPVLGPVRHTPGRYGRYRAAQLAVVRPLLLHQRARGEQLGEVAARALGGGACG